MAPLVLALALCLAQALAAPGDVTTEAPKNLCDLPPEQGRCDAIKHRFAYDKEKSECVAFVYGGCGGNSNNFVSLADCQAACPPNAKAAAPETPVAATVSAKVAAVEELPLGDQPASASKSCGESCPNEAYLTHYEELGCTPIFTDDKKCCASSYDCGSRSLQKDDMCYHEGKAYAVGSEIPSDETPTCLVHCTCTKAHHHEAPRMNCISIECPELFNGPLTDPNCVRQYQRNLCCSSETYCAPTGTSLDKVTDVARCEYGGKNYIEGQKFYPEDKPCLICICQAGFNGTLSEPHCHRAKCNLELHYSHYLRRKCVPIYYQDRCCPIDWSCPEEVPEPAASSSTPATPAVITKESANENVCHFGSKRFALGESLPNQIAGDCVKCKCQVPPVPTCVKNYNDCSKN